MSAAVEDQALSLSTMLCKPVKPLGGKAYGSIGHLPSSRLGPGDWAVHAGQARICCKKPRKGDRVIVTEKVDGACMAVAKIEGSIVALSRAGYLAADALYPHLLAFVPFVDEFRTMFDRLLDDGERVCGEWMALAHGTRYDAGHDGFAPFLAFDLFRDGKRILRDEFVERIGRVGLASTALIHDGGDGFSVGAALDTLREHGFHGAVDPIEGAVWRVEREGRVDFLAKYVMPGKVDGRFLPNISGAGEVWNWRVCV